jgi:hypothetical protein
MQMDIDVIFANLTNGTLRQANFLLFQFNTRCRDGIGNVCGPNRAE